MLKIGIIIFGVLLLLWGIHDFKKRDIIENKKLSNILDILLNGFGSGIGMCVSGVICVIIGIALFFIK
jgi:hypothetical protein